ncbi:MAG: SusC/RagA family TonB-linked outer membrane protein [Pseudopedobacter saltans]|uniref:SusC/RagA family TonB-linked outer membrane protein n=1 Tax=Pseudopedobacter saltans TaxID=151895 RepID=A0A2W5H7A4_9SPHI|nr:MAG: SusC/RagA family TonB-linked outer membrane protein [Pseudopedobacter saltans]
METFIALTNLSILNIQSMKFAIILSRKLLLSLFFLIWSFTTLHSQNVETHHVIGGVVLDSLSQTYLAGVTIYVKGTNINTVSDENGSFRLQNVPNNAILIFSLVGYKGKDYLVRDTSGINIQLSNLGLDEVVVTALGIQRKERSLGFATQKVSGTALQTVKGVDVGTSLTGQVAGLVVLNSTEFNATPTLQLRGESPLLVINGVPYGNLTLRDVPTDDIESIDVLKGPTASALYGSRGSAGAIMVTTKKGKGNRLSIDVNSNNMFTLGYIAIPKVQTSYGHGISGQISTDYVWGPKLDIGDSAIQWNPFTKQQEMMPLVSSGKNNLREFMQTGIISNNNITVMQSGENGFFRAGLNYIYNKGEWPNATLKIINYTMSGQLKIGKKFDAYASMGYTRQTTPQGWGSGYNNQGYLYQILMWTGPDYNIKDYKDYWVVPNQKQNWMYTAWYDNPYLMAYEKLVSNESNKLNASITANYYFSKDLKLMLRSGYDYYSNERTQRNPAGINSTTGGWSPAGYYGTTQSWGLSTNNDLILTYNKNFDRFSFDGLVGGSMYYYIDKTQGAGTVNGLAIPGWYSLANAVPSTVVGVNSISNTFSTSKRQINGAYAKFSTSYDEAIYLDLTGRNDWSSTQYPFQRSYFYPSAALSFILSKYLNLPSWVDMLKLRTSWTVSKYSLGVYSTNRAFSSGTAFGMRTNSYPSSLLGSNLPPSASRTWEYGLGAYLFKKRLHFDVAYFDKLFYNRQVSTSISNASGFSTSLVSTEETYANRGLEITIDGNIMQSRKFTWNSTINYSFVHSYWVDLDPIYSTDDNWHKRGMRTDVYTVNEYAKDPNGNYINVAGLPSKNPYASQIGYGDPKFSFGFINNFTVGNFLFGVNFDGRIGGLMYNYIWDKMFDTGANPETDNQNRYNQVVNKDNSFTSSGVKITSGTATYDKYGNLISDTRQYATNDVAVGYQAYARSFRGGNYGVMSQTFVKLRQVSIGYSIPATTLKKYKGLKSASVSLTGQNLFLWTKFKYSDPDVDTENLNAPSQRMVGLDIKLGF